MSNTADRPGRRGFLGSTLACLAVAPVVSAESGDADQPAAAVDKALAECRQAAEAEMIESQAAYGKALVARFGTGVVDVVRETTIARARQWLQSAQIPKRDLDAVKARVWDRLGPSFEWRLVERTPTLMRFEVTRCPIAEAMRRHGAPELGFAYACAFDIGFCEGLNPKLRFTRSKTLMLGDDRCNHSYELAEAVGSE